jgi:16S rRNA (adenine1518-N6/adenine1519-N6)-dimethyltransferase
VSSLHGRTRALAEEIGLRPSRKLGQSFLVDEDVAERIVALGAPKPGEWLLEIGPGLGALTFGLAGTGARLVAVDRDVRVLGALQRRLGGRAQLVAMDAARLAWGRLASNPPVLVSNLPYPISSKLLIALSQDPPPVRRAVLMLQREVVSRIAAGAGESERGSLSVLVQLSWRVLPALAVPPEAFWPRPEVHSAVVRLEPLPRPLPSPPALRALLRDGFGQRRKTLSNALGLGRRRPADLLERAGLPPRVRAQELTNEQWLVLAELAVDA